MIIHTDIIESTYGRVTPASVPHSDSYFYGVDALLNLVPVRWRYYETEVVEAFYRIELNTKPAMYVHLVHDQAVYGADNNPIRVSDLKIGQRLARFTRVVKHEKYASIRVVPFQDKRVLEHRFVWESHAGMDVPEGYSIDHIDGNSYNNSVENLRHMEIRAHSRMTAQRQRFRNTARNADGSFKKAEKKIHIKSAHQPIPEHLDLGQLHSTCKVVNIEEIYNEGTIMCHRYVTTHPIIMGGLVVW